MKRVLIVDDEPVIRSLVVASLAAADCEVAAAPDGPSAFAALANNRPDLILLDLGLPGIPGEAILNQLRVDPATASIPVLVLTGREPPENMAPDGFLAKPFTPRHLREAVSPFIS